MAEIKTLNGHALVDAEARANITTLSEEIDDLDSELRQYVDDKIAESGSGQTEIEVPIYASNFVYNEYINSSGYTESTDNARAAFVNYIPMSVGMTIFVDDGWMFNFALTENADLTEYAYFYRTYSAVPFIASTEEGYVRFTVKKADDSEFTLDEAATAIHCVYASGNLSVSVDDLLVEDYEPIGAYQISQGWKLASTGLAVQDEDYQIRKYKVEEETRVHIKASKDGDGVYQWQSQQTISSQNTNAVIGSPCRTETDEVVTVPLGATFLMVAQLNTNTTNRVDLVTQEVDAPKPFALGLHKKPMNDGVVNVVRRSRQLTDMVWEPIADIDRISTLTTDTYEHTPVFQDVFSAGKKYTGIPYTNASYNADDYGYDRLFVGSVSFDTFASAIRAEDSAVIKESHYDGANNGTFYGNICSSHVCYALDIEPCFTTNFINVDGMVNRGNLISNGVRIDVNSLEIGEIVIYPGEHVALITDIVRDKDKNVQLIEVSETTKYGNANRDAQGLTVGSLARRKAWTVDGFYDYFKNFSIYRYEKIGDVKYEFTPYSPMVDEANCYPTTDYPLLPYMGNKFVYRKGYIPNSNLLVMCSGFTHVRVLKDGENFNADGTGSLYTVGEGAVTVGFAEPGFYEAYLCTVQDDVEATKSMKCQWRVSDADISVVESEGTVTFTVTTDGEDVPKAVGFSATGTYPEHPWHALDANNMTATDNGDGTVTYVITIAAPTWAGGHCKAALKNKYGVWHSDDMTY